MNLTDEQLHKLALAEKDIGYHFKQEGLLLAAITHPSAAESNPIEYSYERLEFLGDSILGAIVASAAFRTYPSLDEGGLTRIKVMLVSGETLSDVSEELGLADAIVFGHSEEGTGGRGLHSALENVYESIVAALYLDGGTDAAADFVERTLIPRMSFEMSRMPENPKSELQELLQKQGLTPVYNLVKTEGPPHDRSFATEVSVAGKTLAQGTGRTKKESESQAAQAALECIDEVIGADVPDDAEREVRAQGECANTQEQAAR